MSNSPEPAKGAKRRAQDHQNADSVQKLELSAKPAERVRRFGISFLEKESTQILAKNHITSLLFLTILYLTASEDRSVFLFYRNEIYILVIDLQLLFYKGDIINARLLKN